MTPFYVSSSPLTLRATVQGCRLPSPIFGGKWVSERSTAKQLAWALPLSSFHLSSSLPSPRLGCFSFSLSPKLKHTFIGRIWFFCFPVLLFKLKNIFFIALPLLQIEEVLESPWLCPWVSVPHPHPLGPAQLSQGPWGCRTSGSAHLAPCPSSMTTV